MYNVYIYNVYMENQTCSKAPTSICGHSNVINNPLWFIPPIKMVMNGGWFMTLLYQPVLISTQQFMTKDSRRHPEA